jgi:hypothetical protein
MLMPKRALAVGTQTFVSEVLQDGVDFVRVAGVFLVVQVLRVVTFNNCVVRRLEDRGERGGGGGGEGRWEGNGKKHKMY